MSFWTAKTFNIPITKKANVILGGFNATCFPVTKKANVDLVVSIEHIPPPRFSLITHISIVYLCSAYLCNVYLFLA